jgi:23S rRNA pseudouridine1911/1915/1917 synthase
VPKSLTNHHQTQLQQADPGDAEQEAVDRIVSGNRGGQDDVGTGCAGKAMRVDKDLVFDAADAGHRLDQALAARLPEFSRGRIQTWIEAGMVLVDGQPSRARTRMRGGEQVNVRATLEPLGCSEPEAVDFGLVFEDEHLLVIDKPAGLVVHPAAGNWHGTLLNGLLHREPALDRLPRCGIVHRLDKDTSGLLVVARTPLAHQSLTEQLRARTVKREYIALVAGELTTGGRIEAPIGRHPTRRTAMAVVPGGRPSMTDYRILARYPNLSLLAVQLLTGRTHQIRVHMAHLRHPLIGDSVYAGQPRSMRGLSDRAARALRQFPRQALHAVRLGLIHPAQGTAMSWEVPMAPDFGQLMEILEHEKQRTGNRCT